MKLTFSFAAVCVFVFALQFFGIFGGEFAFMPARADSEPWILVTSMFMHADLYHLLLNMLGLFMFGVFLEQLISKKEWVVLYFTSGFVASYGYMLLAQSPFSTAVGASGAIFGLIGGLAVIKPRQVIWTAYGPLPMIAAAVLWGFIELISLHSPGNIAHSAHLFGLIGGVLLGGVYKFGINWKWAFVPAVLVIVLIFLQGHALPDSIDSYELDIENCVLRDSADWGYAKYYIWDCKDSAILVQTIPARKSHDLASAVEELKLEISRLSECFLQNDTILEEDKTAIISGILCEDTVYALQKSCDDTCVRIIQIGGNQKVHEIDCNRLSKEICS